jgi:TonB family protein
MKPKLILAIFLVLFILGCKEGEKLEVIPDYDRIYLPSNQLTEAPQLIEGDSRKLLDSLMVGYDKLYPFADTMKNKPTMEYKFMINENGEIDKVFLGKNNEEKLNQLVLNTVKDWKYKPGVKNGKIVKSQYPMILWFEKNEPINENDYSAIVENMPGPVGGLYSIQEKIVYPEIAKQTGTEGKVIILAFIDESGTVAHAKVLNGIGAGCDKAALNAVKQTRFKPGRQDGKPVKVQVTIPIMFKLN